MIRATSFGMRVGTMMAISHGSRSGDDKRDANVNTSVLQSACVTNAVHGNDDTQSTLRYPICNVSFNVYRCGDDGAGEAPCMPRNIFNHST